MRPDRTRTDILISGGGIAGLTAAALLGSAGFDVVCASAEDLPEQHDGPHRDNRTTAFLQPACKTLEAAGIWDRVAANATPLQVLSLLDAGATGHASRHTVRFDSAELSDQPFGWNISNRLFREAVVERMSELPNVSLRGGVATGRIFPRTRDVVIELSDGSSISCGLLVGADGRNSRVRDALGIGVRTWDQGQIAVAGSVHHEFPHESVSFEIYKSGGPLTLVPTPNREGRFTSALIWMDKAERVRQRSALPQSEFNRELTERSCGVLGQLEVAGQLTHWPVIGQLAHRLTGQRTVILAEAAHVVPPIGAQGLNMSLADIQTLHDLVRSDSGIRDPGSSAVLDRFSRRRWPDIAARVAAVEMLNRASIAGHPVVTGLRLKALEALQQSPAMRKPLMRAGLSWLD